VGTLLQDLRYGIRMLLRNPGFAAVAILTLAIGIGANATVFSWVEAVLVNPVSGVPHSDRLVAAETIMPDGEFHTSSYPDYRDYRDQNDVFSGMAGVEMMPVNMTWTGHEEVERVWGEIVTENFFDVLGVHARFGATFHAKDDKGLNSDPSVILSYGFWQRQFGSNPSVIGQTLSINRRSFTVIGIAPRGFQGVIVGVAPNFWVPMMMQPVVLPGESLTERSPTFVHMIGMLKPGFRLAQAQSDLTTIARRLEREYPGYSRDVGIAANPIWKAHYGAQDYLLPTLVFLSVVALLVLLIACANITNILLARATGREREIAVRAALGAGRSRILSQLLVECLLLAVAGGIGGVLLSLWSANLLMFFLPSGYLPIGLPVGVNGTVLAFTLLTTILTGVIFGIVPALRASSPDLNHSLKEGGYTSSAGAGSNRLRNLLVISEMALALVLLVSAGLLLRSMRRVQTASPGFNPRNVLLAAFDLRGDGYTGDSVQIFYARLVDRLRALPGVESASMEEYVPLWFYGKSYTKPQIEGYTPRPNEDMDFDRNFVGPDYFSLMQIPLVEGRDFTDADRAGAPLVAIINQTMAQRFWPGQSALGHHIGYPGQWRTIVGVAKDIRYHSMTEQPESFLYTPSLQSDQTAENILVRTSRNPADMLRAVRDAARSLDPQVSVLQAATVDELFQQSLFYYGTSAALGTVLGALGMFLAALGIYGVLAYTVSRRTHEIGVRMALGARPGDVLRLVIGHGALLAGIGAAIGIVASLAVMRLMSNLLYGIRADDPATFASVAVLLAIVALAACYIPARRAMKVDPVVALRYE
jgi:macrolide transport system ATP-binding/permease protein